MLSSRLTPSFRYNTSHGTIVADRQAVAAGTATEDQANRVSCLFLFDICMCFKLLMLHVSMLLRCEASAPTTTWQLCCEFWNLWILRSSHRYVQTVFAARYFSLTTHTTFVFQVPDYLKTGLKNQRLSNLRAGSKTQEQVQVRLELVAAGGYGEHFAPYSDAAMDAALEPLLTRVEAILAENLVRFFTLLTPCTPLILPWQGYVGFTTRSDSGFDAEVAAWVTSQRAFQYAPAVTQLNGTLFKNRQDLEDFGFKVCCFLVCFVFTSQLMCTRAGGNPASAPVRLQL